MGQETPKTLQEVWGEKRSKFYTCAEPWLKAEKENLPPKAETEESAILIEMGKGNFPFAREHPHKVVILALEELRQDRSEKLLTAREGLRLLGKMVKAQAK